MAGSTGRIVPTHGGAEADPTFADGTRAFAGTPHLLVAGGGAEAFARRLGMPVENRWTTLAQERFEKLADKLRCDDPEKKDCERACDACREPWNYGEPFGELYGVPPRGPRGQPRVSDTVGAVACTGQGEHPQEVPRECLGLGPEQAPLGLVILDRHRRHAAGGRCPMPGASCASRRRPLPRALGRVAPQADRWAARQEARRPGPPAAGAPPAGRATGFKPMSPRQGT